MEKVNTQNSRSGSMPLRKEMGLMNNWFNSDGEFDALYPPSIRALAKKHWTPLHVARKAADFLAAEDNVSILDIGSGVGKFCLAAAHYKPGAFYSGVEQRKNLIAHAERAREVLSTDNAAFICANFTQIDFRKYDHFYFYNSFYENLVGTEKIDNSIVYSGELFNYYNRYLFNQLEQKPTGTRLVTYHSLEDEIPKSYYVVESQLDALLKFWVKI